MEEYFLPNFTQAPNYFFDVLLNQLSSTEVHVMCAIIRKTYGWHKAEDKISFSQLTQATNLALSTVQSAIKKLIDKGIVVSRIVDGVRAYSFLVEKKTLESQSTSKEPLPAKSEQNATEDKQQNNSYIPNNGIDNAQNNSYIPASGMEVYRIPVTPPLPESGNTERTAEKKELKKGLGLLADRAGFFDAVSFDFDKKVFDMTQEHEDKYTELYKKKIESLGLNMTEIYQDACKRVVERQNTNREVKNFGKWLDNFFKDASFGNVFKRGAQNKAEQKNFETNYELFCSLEHYKDMKVSGIFLIVKGKEYNFYSAPEIFKEAFRDHEL